MISPVYIQSMSSILPANGEPDYKALIPNPTLRRRMSRVVKMGVACALDCLAGQPYNEVEAIITATGLGCLADTEKFMNNLLDNNEQLLNPTAFIQSTFNTVGAQIALLCKNHSYNVTYAHRGFSFESALLDSILRIYEGDKRILVGAFDEITPTSLDIQQRLGLYRYSKPGEGSHFFLLGTENSEKTKAAVYAPLMLSGNVNEEQIETHLLNYLHSHNLDKKDVSVFLMGDNKVKSLLPHAEHHTFKDLCGDYHTASAYALWYGSQLAEVQPSGKYTLIYNQWNGINHSMMLLKSC